jgi:type IV secretory pathway VirB6-like protein
VPIEAVFQKTATELDAALIEGMNVAIDAGLAWIAPQLRIALGLYVIGYAFLMMYGRVEGWTLASAVGRAMAVAAILKIDNYSYYVRDLFFTDLPNQLARAMNGPRITVNSAQQFDNAWLAVLHYTALILGQSSGFAHIDDRVITWVLAYMNFAALCVCFAIWYISRAFMAIVICLGPFLIILFLFRSTRGFVEQWIGKLVALTVLGLSASILLRIILIIMSSRLRGIHDNPGISVDEMIANAASVTGVFWLGALMMFVLPSAIAIGSGIGASVAVTSGILGSAGVAAGGLARAGVTRAGRLGIALGRYTGSRA